MRALLVYGTEPACGVNQYGENLMAVLAPSRRVDWKGLRCDDFEALDKAVRLWQPDAILYNWQSGQGGYLAGAPFDSFSARQCLVYHDNDIQEERWSAILFSDPTMPRHGRWFPIGRPLPEPRPSVRSERMVTVGVHGFLGAWADRVVSQVISEFKYASVRLSLPLARFGDDHGNICGAMAEKCRDMVRGTGISLEISTDFKPLPELISWLSGNTVNCYFRDPAWNWRGVASSPDSALAARRPLAVTKCNAFRHLHGTSPSICIEDSSLRDIIASGLAPLATLYERWSADNVRNEVDNVVLGL